MGEVGFRFSLPPSATRAFALRGRFPPEGEERAAARLTGPGQPRGSTVRRSRELWLRGARTETPMAELLHVVCPHCDAANRLPAARLSQGPKCGRCHKALFTGGPVALDTPRF